MQSGTRDRESALFGTLSRMGNYHALDSLPSKCIEPILSAFKASSALCLLRKNINGAIGYKSFCAFNQAKENIQHYFDKFQDSDPVQSRWDHIVGEKEEIFSASEITIRRTPQFKRFLENSSVNHILVVGFSLTNCDETAAMLAFHRKPGEPDFDHDDRDFARRSAPLLRQAVQAKYLESAYARLKNANDELFASHCNAPLVLVDEDLNVLNASKTALTHGHWTVLKSSKGRLQAYARDFLMSNETETTIKIGEGPSTRHFLMKRTTVDDNQFILLFKDTPQPSKTAIHLMLTPRQCEVAELVANGCRNWQIAELLNVSENTVVNHLSTIYDKVGIGSRTELAVRWNASTANA
ncbi:MAG: LuxR C-terminal-related transcriptional regulator [Pseudomonadota bacterium]